MNEPPKVGDKAPDFELPEASEEMLRLYDELSLGGVMILFYPTDFGIICTIEMKTFREHCDELVRRGVRILGISTDRPHTHRAWKERLDLPFRLLGDPDGRVSALYGVLRDDSLLKRISERAVFLIDQGGTVRYAWVAKEKAISPDFEEVMEAVRQSFEEGEPVAGC